MSFNNLLNTNPNTGHTIVEDIYFQKQLEHKEVFFNPATDWTKSLDGQLLRPRTIYWGSDNGLPTWEYAVFDVNRYQNAKKAYKNGSLNKDQATFRPWLDSKLEDAAARFAMVQKYGRAAAKEFLSGAGGVMTSGDNPAIALTQMLGETMGMDNPQFVLEQAVRTIATPNLTLTVPQFKGFEVSTNVGEGVETLVRKGEYITNQYFLTKDVAHIQATDEARLVGSPSIWNDHVQHAVYKLGKAKNQKIAAEIEAQPNDITGNDWYASTGGVSTTDPVREIGKAISVIRTNGGNPDTIVSNGLPNRAFSTNSRIIGTGQAIPNLNYASSVIQGIAGLSGMTWYVDDLKTDTEVAVYDKTAVVLMQGPVKAAQYRIEATGVDAFITRDYNLIKVIDATRVRNIVGVAVTGG